MRTRILLTASASLAVIICTGLLLFRHIGGYRYDSEVERIINTPQTYGGEIQDNLVALGPDAAPALGRKLFSDYEFPMTLVMALGTIGDPRGTAPLLEFLDSYAPHEDKAVGALPTAAIEALKDIGNPRACDTLAAIYPVDDGVSQGRLGAAAAVARICAGTQQADARAYVFARYREMKADRMAFSMGWDHLVYKALIDVNTDESNAILIDDILKLDNWHYLSMPVIEHMPRVGGEEVIDGLMAIVASPESRYEMHYRIAAAGALLDLGVDDSPELDARIRELLDDAVRYERPESFIADARRLVNRIDSR